MVVYDEVTQCLYLKAGTERVPVVWPSGASWQEDPPAVVIGDFTINLGEVVKGSGGYLKQNQVSSLAGESVAEAAHACAGPTGEIAFFNRGSSVRVVER